MSTNATKQDLKKALAQTTNKKIENNENLTKEEIKELQTTAQDKILAFDSSLEKALSKNYTTKSNSKNEMTLKRENISFKLCYKSQKQLITVYHNVANNETRNKMLELYKYTKNVRKTANTNYLNSKINKEFKLEVTHVEVNKELLKLIDEIFDNIKQAHIDANKAMKKAK